MGEAPERYAEQTPLTRERLLEAVALPQVTLAYQVGNSPGAGFSAAFLGLSTTLTHCLQRGIGFRLGRIHRAVGFAPRRGWCDFFAPFCGEVDAPFIDRLNRSQFPFQRRFPLSRMAARLWLRSTTRPRVRYFMFDDPVRLPAPPSGETEFAHRDFWQLRQEIAPLIWVFDAQTRQEVAAVHKGLGLPRDYVALHIRRGDKNTEFPYVKVERYAQYVRERIAVPGTLLVATDDFRILREVEARLAGWTVRSAAEPESGGYRHGDFVRLPAAEKRRRNVLLLAEVEAMRGASHFFGSRTTNVAWLVNLLRKGEGVTWVDDERGAGAA